MLLPMKAFYPQTGDTPPNEPFVPDLSEGAEIGVYLALLELIAEGLIITSDERIIDANSAACRLLGRSYRQLAGQPLADLFADERAFLDARSRLLIQGETRGCLTLALPDGQTRTLPYIAAPRLRPGIHAIILGYDPWPMLDAIEAPILDWQPLRNCPIALRFQPRGSVREQAVQAGEALFCWSPADAPPQIFDQLSAAWCAVNASGEEVEMEDFSAWALTAACHAAAAWRRAADAAPLLSINIDAEQLRSGKFAPQVGAALAVSRLDPRALELAIDARALALPEDELSPCLQALARLGIRLAVDNFGLDLLPLALFAHHRLETLKLAPALVQQIGIDDVGTAQLEAIARMAEPMGVRVLAKGVADTAQRDFLLALGIECQQGPFRGVPMDEAAFSRFAMKS
ncbi:MAG: EAL domain-containing protein [Azoarcus sp.]|jgi:EAL domain-containing protein (putative c-di-GMP-specific phosphodiesterase class I)|nr:EAL domain-containing protein [Azoarcus sp.]